MKITAEHTINDIAKELSKRTWAELTEKEMLVLKSKNIVSITGTTELEVIFQGVYDDYFMSGMRRSASGISVAVIDGEMTVVGDLADFDDIASKNPVAHIDIQLGDVRDEEPFELDIDCPHVKFDITDDEGWVCGNGLLVCVDDIDEPTLPA